MIEPDDAIGRHAVFDARNLHQRNLGRTLRTDTRKDSECPKAWPARPSSVARPPGCSCRHPAVRSPATPLMALVAEFATSRLVIPARLARSGSTFRLTCALSVVPLVANSRCRRSRAQDVLHLRRDLSHRPDVLCAACRTHVRPARDSDLDRDNSPGLVCNCRMSMRAPGTVADSTGCT